MIYLDNASTTKPKRQVINAMMPYFTDEWYNPSSLYGKASEIKKDVEAARKTVANYINADKNEIYFTSGGSEGNCWAIQGFVNHCIANNAKPYVITSSIEHKSIIDCVNNLNNSYVYFIDVDKEGFINVAQLKNTLMKLSNAHITDILVSIQFANNEIGTIQHIKEIAEMVHRFNGVFHTDAVQAFGHIPIDVKELGIDMLTASGHKIGTPKGVGFLYKESSIEIDPLIYGSQMDGMRGGTENVPYIIGMAKAVNLIKKDEEYQLRLTVLRNNFIAQLKSLGCKINGSVEERLPNNINVVFLSNVSGEALIYTLDIAGVYLSSGSACNSRSIEPSHVLKAIGLSNEEAMKTIRITISDNITMEEIDKAMYEISKAIKIIDCGGDL